MKLTYKQSVIAVTLALGMSVAHATVTKPPVEITLSTAQATQATKESVLAKAQASLDAANMRYATAKSSAEAAVAKVATAEAAVAKAKAQLASATMFTSATTRAALQKALDAASLARDNADRARDMAEKARDAARDARDKLEVTLESARKARETAVNYTHHVQDYVQRVHEAMHREGDRPEGRDIEGREERDSREHDWRIPPGAGGEEDISKPWDGRSAIPTVTLDPTKVYNRGFRITTKTNLDCKGAIIDGQNRIYTGLLIDSLGNDLSGITIKNCTFRNFTRLGIGVTWSEFNDVKEANNSREQLYLRTPHNIKFQNVVVENMANIGIFLDDWSSNVTLDRVTVRNTASVGIYFENSSKGHTLMNSVISNNGWTYRYPGLGIDSSSNNKILNNQFEHNAVGGIQLYRNCWEYAKTNPHSVLRWMGATNNLIAGNTFTNETVGVWVGSRMSKNLKLMECGIQPYYVAPTGEMYYPDDAKRNNITGNRFDRISGSGVVIEDDYNKVTNNSFLSTANWGINVGSSMRYLILNQPVKGTVVTDNRFTDMTKAINWGYGSAPAQSANNGLLILLSN